MDAALRSGPYGEAERGLSIEYLQQHPSGVDLGPLMPSCPQRLQTPDKRINCAPAELLQDLARLDKLMDRDLQTGLRLIGRRHVRSNNSWLHNSYRLVKGKPRCQLLVHPDDVLARSLSTGQRAILRSRVGEIEVEVLASDEIMPGTVSLPHGWGHHREGSRLQVAAAHAGVTYRNYYDPDLSVVTDVEELGIEESSGRRIWVLTTLEREMATIAPVLLDHIHAEYERVRYLPGSVGDGAIRIYVRNADP